jgi:hypothetical protein
MPDRITSMTGYLKALQRAVAHEVSTSIIPHQRMRAELLPAFLANPHGIPMDKLVDEYGVDRRYVAAAYLRAYEKHLAAHPELIPTYTKRDPISKTIPHRVYLTETILRTGMDEAFLIAMLKHEPMPNTIGFLLNGNPESALKMTRALKAEKKRIDELRAARREETMRFDGTDRGTWESQRAEKTKAKAQKIAGQLLNTETNTNTGQPELLRLRTLTCPTSMPTTVWRPRPSALLLYAHKHIIPILAPEQATTLRARLHEQAMHVLNHTRKYIEDTRLALTERYLIAMLANVDPITLLLPHSHLLPERDIALVHGLVRAHTRHSPLK